MVGWWGYRAAYTVDAVTFTAALYAMWRLPSMLPERGDDAGSEKRASVVGGLRFPAARPVLRMTFFTDLCAMVLAHPRALFPVVAVLWYGGDAKTTGLLVAAPALGALLGGVFSGWLSRIRRHGLAVIAAVTCWGSAIAVFGLTRQLWLGLVLLALAGCADTVSMVFRNTMLQAAVPDEMRGRLQGVFIVVVAGGPRLGDFLAGSVADLASPTVAATGGGIACVIAVSLLALKWRGFARYDARSAALTGRGPVLRADRPRRRGSSAQAVTSESFGISPSVVLTSITENAAPCGSLSAANRPNGLVIGPNRRIAPRSVAFATAASQSSTVKYTLRYGGTSGGKSSVILIRPRTGSAPRS